MPPRRLPGQRRLGNIAKRLAFAALTVGKRSDSLEPTQRLSLASWAYGRHLQGPSARAKQRHIERLIRVREHRSFVEAGTFKGATIEVVKDLVDQVVSVELDPDLYLTASQRFQRDSRIQIIEGDALALIPQIVSGMTHPPLVYLDGHCSGAGTATGKAMEPAAAMLEELGHASPLGTTVVVDDLRLFGSGLLGFPQIDELTAAARLGFPTSNLRVGLDSLVIESPRD